MGTAVAAGRGRVRRSRRCRMDVGHLLLLLESIARSGAALSGDGRGADAAGAAVARRAGRARQGPAARRRGVATTQAAHGVARAVRALPDGRMRL
eukprot:5728480-Pleurochrysis_carterae.AAC.1